VPLLRKQPGAAIVNVASVAGSTGVGSSIAYAAAKAGVITMTKSLDRALAPEIRVNAISPGLIRTHLAGRPHSRYKLHSKKTKYAKKATGNR
jgi:3-oxoacyl-[acyl-carrier protein] reductase